MEGYFPTGVQLGFHRRLSRLYNDTKKSSDFVKEAPQNAEDPEVKALHRKLRIQKDRLVSWGLEWSDPSQSAEVLIDSSLSKAGLSEVVGSIMSTIKDILAEAEPLWLSSKSLAGEKPSEKTSPAERKLPIVAWDKGRFEDLVRDLTTSIDTLYDLSRTRSSAVTSSQAARARLLKTGSSSMEDMRPFESTRMQTPQVIDPTTLTNLRSMQAEPMSETAMTTRPRDIVFMSKQAYAEMTSTTARSQYSPLLLEYANFDPIFSTTGIMPSMSRFEKLSSGLQTEPRRSPGSWNGLPQLLGYFEDMEHSRLGLVYQFPPSFNPVTFEHLTQNPLNNMCSLADLLRRPDFEPKLEAKFRLASNLANTVFDMHARGIAHGHLVDSNISFCNATGVEPGISAAEVDVRRPLLSSFDLFPDSPAPEGEGSILSPYRHPLDPRLTAARGQAPLVPNADPRVFDLYSLAMILLSLGLWTDVANLVPNSATATIPEAILDQLAIRCGTLYMKAVQACWTAVDKETSGQIMGDTLLAKVQMKASRYLDACCILDGVSSLEERLSDDLGEPRAASQPVASSSKGEASSSKKAAEASRARVTLSDPPVATKPSVQPPPPLKAPAEKPKLRLYPQVTLSPETIEQWHTFLMPQINQALRHFFRQHPESVEISLESIGKSSRETTPTVLIVCTSVKKVRAIVTRKLGALFDEGTGFALKVCRGSVLRSRKQPAAGESTGNEIVAANGKHQVHPENGASIGAWIGDRHLPPVSFGGLVMVDDKPYGMTVHHMLDDPEVDGEATATEENVQKIMRSSSAAQEIEQLGQSLADWYAELQAEQSTSSITSDADFACQFSDTETDAYTESDITSTYSDSDDGGDDYEREEYGEPGDIPGIEPGCGEGYIVTQPALDDVAEGFFEPATQDEDHLETFHLGEIHASSGIRRRRDENELIHEIDWALFEFSEERLPNQNSIPHASAGLSRKASGKSISGRLSQLPSKSGVFYPTTVAAAADLPGMEVQCIARTSGLQTGQILPVITSVKIYGRTTPSHTYQITGSPPVTSGSGARPLPMGIPGDSGAWIVERGDGRLCGHVLAWSQRKKVAYICPMEMLLLDIAETLEAREVGLPGGEPVVKIMDPSQRESVQIGGGQYEDTDEGYDGSEDLGDLVEEEYDGNVHRSSKAHHLPAPAVVSPLGSPTRCSDQGDLPEDLGKLHIGNDGVQTRG